MFREQAQFVAVQGFDCQPGVAGAVGWRHPGLKPVAAIIRKWRPDQGEGARVHRMTLLAGAGNYCGLTRERLVLSVGAVPSIADEQSPAKNAHLLVGIGIVFRRSLASCRSVGVVTVFHPEAGRLGFPASLRASFAFLSIWLLATIAAAACLASTHGTISSVDPRSTRVGGGGSRPFRAIARH